MTTPSMRAAHRLLTPGFVAWFRMEVTGKSNVPGAGGVLLAGNHRSFLDHFAMSAACPRPMRFLGKVELAQGAMGRMNKLMGMVPVDRGKADVTVIDTVADLLREGEVVGVFPEGTRSPTGELFRFRSGLARIAAAAQVPVVPVGIVGAAQVWPRGAPRPVGRPAPGVLSVHMGEVLDPPQPEPRSRRAFTEECHARIAALCGQPPAPGFAPIDPSG